MRCLPASDRAMLVELADLDEALALFLAMQRHPIAGVEEAIPAARTLLVHFRPAVLTAQQLVNRLQRLQTTGASQDGRATAMRERLEIPVRYDGEDLGFVAEILGISAAELIERHTSCDYLAAFAGFAPGYVYLSGGHPSFHIPRRQAPRTRVPAGAVALAGTFSCVYPSASPGGWQLIGVTPLRMWDLQRNPPALMRPGMHIRFRDLARNPALISLPAIPSSDAVDAPAVRQPKRPADASPAVAALRLEVSGLQTLVQDLGRPGKTDMGISTSGALDQGAMRSANRLVGNPSDAAVLENLLGGLRLVCQGSAVVAITGADAPVDILTADGQRLAAATNRALVLEDGDRLSVGAPVAGVRCYVAVRGGFEVPPVLDSCATDTLALVGPEPLRSGDVLPVGDAIAFTRLQAVAVATAEPPWPLPRASDVVTLDVTLGPRTDWFEPEAVALLLAQEWTVTPQSNRVGMRLCGAQALTRRNTAELPSEGTVTGAIQVPANGQPVLFLADHPLTGGYPVIGAVASYHLDLAAQIPVGARLRFRALHAFGAIDGADASQPTPSLEPASERFP